MTAQLLSLAGGDMEVVGEQKSGWKEYNTGHRQCLEVSMQQTNYRMFASGGGG